MKIRYTPQAQLDLRAIKDYIGNKLMNKSAAIRISRAILKSCSLLKDNPYLGRDLSDMIDEPSDYRYIICERYLVFYLIEEGYISVERIVDGRTDYVSTIFDI